ncbi:hypothetical protein CHARACLAT_027258, partial [Characodon lateralis]|nr:hypothetical protein [Characodon lateralis]
PPLQRGSSFTFLTPGTPWDFSLKRKRKEKEDDTISLSSFDLKIRVGDRSLTVVSAYGASGSAEYPAFLVSLSWVLDKCPSRGLHYSDEGLQRPRGKRQ